MININDYFDLLNKNSTKNKIHEKLNVDLHKMMSDKIILFYQKQIEHVINSYVEIIDVSIDNLIKCEFRVHYLILKCHKSLTIIDYYLTLKDFENINYLWNNTTDILKIDKDIKYNRNEFCLTNKDIL